MVMAPMRKRIRMMYAAADDLARAVGCGDEDAEADAEMLFLSAIVDMYEPALTHPRAEYVQADFAVRSLWKSIRESRREGAFIKFLGIPTFLFDELAERMKDVVPPEYNRGAAPRWSAVKTRTVPASLSSWSNMLAAHHVVSSVATLIHPGCVGPPFGTTRHAISVNLGRGRAGRGGG